MKKTIIFLSLFCSMTLSVKAQQTYTLDKCLELARQNNIDLRNAALEIEAAGEQQSEAYTKYFPKIQANVMAFQAVDKILKVDGSYPDELAAIPQLASMAGQPFVIHELSRAYAASVSAIQPIYAGGQITAGNKLAAIQKDVMVLQLSMKEKDVMQKVTECYWQIAKVKYNLSTLDQADKQVKAVYYQVNNFVKAGVTTSNDLLKVKLRQQELASNRVKLKNAELVLRMLLAQQIGMDITSDSTKLMDIKLPENDAIALSSLSGSDSSLSNREELQLALKGVEAQQQQMKMVKGKLLPTIAVGIVGYNSGLGGYSSNARAYCPTNMTNALIMGTISIPISDWWGGSHAIKQQKIKIQQAQNTVDDTRHKLLLDIESARSNVSSAYEQIQIAKASVEQAEENLRMSTNQYHAGTETITDLLDAETLNRQCKNNLSTAIADYQTKLADYIRKTR